MAGQIQLFDRRCKVTFAIPVDTPGDFTHTTTNLLEVDGGRTDAWTVGQRVQFKVEKTLTKEPNTSSVTITNLAPQTRQQLQSKGVRVLIEAGYKDGVERIFSGDVRTVDHVRSKADWDTVCKVGDGERAWRFARVAESFAVGSRAADVLKKVGRAMGIDLGNLDDKAAKIDTILDQGWSAAGSAARALDRLVVALGKEWSIQDGALQILDPYETIDYPIPDITPDTGLIDSPEMGSPATKGKPQLLKFKSLLVITKPGARVKLKSQRYDGYVRVHRCSFEGDTSGGDWYTTIEGTISK